MNTRIATPSIGLLIFFLALSVPSAPKADLFQLRDQNPLIVGYGLPLLSTSELPGRGQWQGTLAYNLSNTLNSEGKSPQATDYLLIDGETAVLDIQFLRGWGDRWAWGIHLPFIRHSAGDLDGFIENYHDVMGLPQGDRPRVPRDRMAFVVRHNGRELLNLSEASSGPGDIGLLLAYQWVEGDDYKLALHAKLKLPTGQADRLTGSNGIDYANWLTVQRPLDPDWTIAGYLGFILLEEGDILPDLQNRQVFFGGGGLEWHFSSTLTFRLQADMHTGFYKDTGFRFLNEALILNMGGTLKLTDRVALDISVGEDIMVGASADVSFHSAIRLHW